MLANTCHHFIVREDKGIRCFSTKGANGLPGIQEDSVKEIELLIDVSNKQYLKLRDEKKQLELEIVELKDLAFKNQFRSLIKTTKNKEG